MPTFLSDGLTIAYEVYGQGKPVILVHGFGSNGIVNWVNTGWTEALNTAGYQAITLDNRGHGQSEKLYDPALYPARLMAHDVINLMDEVNVSAAALIGYSMGARISAFACIDAPLRVTAAVFGGMGINMVRGMRDSAEIVNALKAPNLADISDPTGRQYRIFADHTKSDRLALAACMESGREKISEAQLQSIHMPVLVAVGSEDAVSGAAAPLAALLAKGEVLDIPGRDHMRATGDKVFKQGTLDFLARVY